MENSERNTFFRETFLHRKTKLLSNKIKRMLKLYVRKEKIAKEYNQEKMKTVFPFQSIPNTSYSVKEYVSELENKLLPYTVNVGAPKFIGHMTSALPNFVPEVARLISTLNQNVVKLETSLSATFYERQAIAMLHELFYNAKKDFYNTHIHAIESTLGIITSGGTIANLTALQCARNKTYPNLEKKGFYQEQEGVVICSELGHYSIKKAMSLLGMGSINLITIPTDDKNKIRVDLLEEKITEYQRKEHKIIAIIGVAGTTECGSIDPLEVLSKIAKTYNIYFHVDAAWGGPIQFSEEHSYLLNGIENADSITIDGHKQLYLPMGLGLVLFKHPKTATLIEKKSEYIIRKNSIDLGKRTIEGSRPANSFYLQAGLKLLGKQKYGWLIDKGIENAKFMASYIDSLNDFELLTYPETNIFLYRYLPEGYNKENMTELLNNRLNTFNKALQKKQLRTGSSFVSFTTVVLEKYGKQKIIGLRVVLANPLVKIGHLFKIIEEQRNLAKQILIPLNNKG